MWPYPPELQLKKIHISISPNPKRILLFKWSRLEWVLGLVISISSTDAGWFCIWSKTSMNFKCTFSNIYLSYKVSWWLCMNIVWNWLCTFMWSDTPNGGVLTITIDRFFSINLWLGFLTISISCSSYCPIYFFQGIKWFQICQKVNKTCYSEHNMTGSKFSKGVQTIPLHIKYYSIFYIIYFIMHHSLRT